MGTLELVQEVIHAREWVEFIDRHFVERPKVDAEAEGAIILLDEVGFLTRWGSETQSQVERMIIPLVSISMTAASMQSWSRGERQRVAMRMGAVSPVRMTCCTEKEKVAACVGWGVSDGKRANNWRMEINRSLGLRAT